MASQFPCNESILEGFVARGSLKSFKLETVQEVPGESSRQHDRLTLVFPNDEPLVIDTVCSGSLENCEIFIEIPAYEVWFKRKGKDVRDGGMRHPDALALAKARVAKLQAEGKEAWYGTWTGPFPSFRV